MRTTEEIKERIELELSRDVLALSIGDLIARLPFSEAEGYLNDPDEQKWVQYPSDHETIKEELVEYISFAWEKALGHRGISASRSIGHFRNWLWLMEDGEALAFVENEDNYPQYGVPMLKYLSDRFGYEYDEEDEDVRLMASGRPCTKFPGCGCGE